jgi:hypothetical protein
MDLPRRRSPFPRESDHPVVYHAERDSEGGARKDQDQDPG